MRRFGTALALILVTAGAFSSIAFAKEGGVELSSTPVGTKPGDPWMPRLTLVGDEPDLLAQAKPGVTIRRVDTGREITFRAKPTDDPHVWNVRVVFPEPGWWTVDYFDGVTGRSYSLGGQWLVEDPSAAPTSPTPRQPDPSGGGFPVWPIASGGILAVLLAAGGAAFFLRRQRPELSH
jgi:hypothetical protein